MMIINQSDTFMNMKIEINIKFKKTTTNMKKKYWAR